MSALAPTVQRVAERLQGLTLQEKDVLRLRFALDGHGNCTLAEVAEKLRITLDDVRQIEQRALLTLAGGEA